VVEQPQPLPADTAYPDINTVPTERPQPVIVDIFSAPQGLKADTSNADHSEEMTGGPTSSAAPPPPPPIPLEEPSLNSGEQPSLEPAPPPAVETNEPPADQQQSRSTPPVSPHSG